MKIGNPHISQRRVHAVLEVDVLNRPGALSHVVGLFARRSCNVDSIVCFPATDGSSSRLWLKIADEGKVLQMAKHVENLHDVVAVRISGAAATRSFAGLPGLFGLGAAQDRQEG